MLDALVGAWAGTLIDMFVELEVVISAIRTKVVDDLRIDILVAVGVSDVEIIVAAAAVIALEFVVPESRAVDVLAGMLVDVVGDALAGVLAGVTICVVPGIGVDVLTEVNTNVLATITIVEIAVPALLIEPLRAWPIAPAVVLECVHALQA